MFATCSVDHCPHVARGGVKGFFSGISNFLMLLQVLIPNDRWVESMNIICLPVLLPAVAVAMCGSRYVYGHST
jgi:hypothetical protein